MATDRTTELQAMLSRSFEALVAELMQGRSERLERYLRFTARFYRYSPQNQALIFEQMPEATRVAGYRTWQKLGYQVAKGAKGIRILAPRPYTRLDAKTGEDTSAIFFASVAVFDASQLVPDPEHPVPVFFEPLGDDQQELYERLMAAVRRDGISVTESAHTEGAQGYSANKRIVLKPGLDSRSRVLVLLHEWGHELLHWGEDRAQFTKVVKECQAEATSFVVAQHLGMEAPYSADYLTTWGTTPDVLRAQLDAVSRAANHIIQALQLTEKVDEDPAAEEVA
jgi:hypothetical protein